MSDEYSTIQIVVAALGSSGIVGASWTLFVFISGKLEARRKKQEEDRKKEISNAADLRRVEAETGESATKLLWDLIRELKSEVKDLKADLEAAEQAEILTRPAVMHIYECVRQIKNEMDSLNIMLLSDEETNVFARRWANIKAIMVELEATLAGQKADAKEARDLKGGRGDNSI